MQSERMRREKFVNRVRRKMDGIRTTMMYGIAAGDLRASVLHGEHTLMVTLDENLQLLQTPRTFLPAATVVDAATVFPCDHVFHSFIQALDYIYLAAEDIILAPTVWRMMRDVVSHCGTGGTSQRILEVLASAGTRGSLVIRLGREILAGSSRYGVTGANCNPDGSDSAFNDVNTFDDTIAEVTQRYVKNSGHGVGMKVKRDGVGDADAQKEVSGGEEHARTSRAVQNAGPNGRAQTADNEHTDATARLSIVQNNGQMNGCHETARRGTSYRAEVVSRQDFPRAAMRSRHGQLFGRHFKAPEVPSDSLTVLHLK
jgi:hypothetical protein